METAKPTIYLAGGISHLSYEEATGWRRDLIEQAGDRAIILDPMRGKEVLEGTKAIALHPPEFSHDDIFGRNIADIESSNYMIVNWDSVKSIGTPMEVGFAYAEGVIVTSYCTTIYKSHPFMVGMSQVILDSLIDCLEWCIEDHDRAGLKGGLLRSRSDRLPLAASLPG